MPQKVAFVQGLYLSALRQIMVRRRNPALGLAPLILKKPPDGSRRYIFTAWGEGAMGPHERHQTSSNIILNIVGDTIQGFRLQT